MPHQDPRAAAARQAQQREDDEVAKNPKPPTVPIEDRLRDVLARIQATVDLDSARVRALRAEITPRLTHDPRNGDRRTMLLAGYEVPFGDECLAEELADREWQRTRYEGKTPQEHLIVRLVGLGVPLVKAASYTHHIRGLDDGRIATRVPGAANEAYHDDLDVALRFLASAVLRDLELERRREAARPLIEELAKQARERYGGGDHGL